MKVIISQIPDEGRTLFRRVGAGELGFSRDEIEGAVDVTVSIHRTGETSLYFEGTLGTTIRLQCSRCLKEFPVPVEIPFAGQAEPEPGPQEEDLELNRAEIDLHFYQGDVLDFNEIIHEQIVLAIPMRPLCTEGCKGLCPRCGQDLNERPCSCTETSNDPRWDALKRLAG